MNVITANRLLDGEVVWLGDNGHWSETLQGAKVLESAEDVAEHMAIAKQAIADRFVVEAYEMAVKHEDGKLVPVRYREVIRAAGPTILPGLGKQAKPVAV
ncbi:MAG: DUF2849 domain-containing protein [Rhodobacteraceae bacterium]|nr:DUF2849 domain-containing protein [Paracoccaceae bacterium]